MLYTIPLHDAIAIASGFTDPVLWFENRSTGLMTIKKVTVHAEHNDLGIILKRNVGPLADVGSSQFSTAISGLVPHDSGVTVLTSGFSAQVWDQTAGTAGISGLNPLLSTEVVSASLASKSSHPGEAHWHGGLRLNPNDAFTVSAKNFEGSTYGRVLMTVELEIDTASSTFPVIGEQSDIHAEP